MTPDRHENASTHNANNARSAVRFVFPLPYERNPHFTGRDALLEELSKKISDTAPKRYPHRVALHGLGGIGKTQIALEFAYRQKSEYRSVYWISAVDQSRLLAGFAEIASYTLCVEPAPGEPPDMIAKAVVRWLEVTKSWLLVIDNLDDIKIVDGYLPRNGGHILITTRNRNSDGIPAEGLEVTVMDLDNSVQFFLDRARMNEEPILPETHEETVKIVTGLGCLPLAIEHAAAYVRNSNLTEYLEIFDKKRREILEWQPQGNHPYKYTVATTWTMSLDRLQTSCPDSIIVAQYLAFLNPDEIPLEFLEAGKEDVQPDMQPILSDRFRLRVSLNALESFSLVRVFSNGANISIHRLLQVVIKDALASDRRATILDDIIEVGLRNFPNPGWHGYEMLDKCRRYRSQIVASLEDKHGATCSSRWLVLSERLANYMSRDGFYEDALRWRRAAFEVRENEFGHDPRKTLSCIENLAFELSNVGQRKEALQLREKAVDIAKGMLGEEDRVTLRSLVNRGGSYCALGESDRNVELLSKGVKILEEAFSSCKKVLGAEDKVTLLCMSKLANGLLKMKRVAEAIPLLEETQELQIKVFGREHQETLLTIMDLAYASLEAGRAEKSQQLFEELLRVQRQYLSPKHPRILECMSGLGWSIYSLKRYEEAADILEEVLESRKLVLGANHRATQRSARRMAMVLCKLGRHSKAAELLEYCLGCQKSVRGEAHPSTLADMEMLAIEFIHLGRRDEGVQLQEKILELREKILSADHPHTIWSKQHLRALGTGCDSEDRH